MSFITDSISLLRFDSTWEGKKESHFLKASLFFRAEFNGLTCKSMILAWDFVLCDVKPQQRSAGPEGSHGGEWHTSSYSESGWRDEMHRTEKRGGESAQINTSMGSLCFRLALTGKMPSCSWRSSTSFTSVDMLLLLGVCQAPVSIPRPGRQGKTLLANWRHSGQVNSPLSTENPWRTWSFWKQTNITLFIYRQLNEV